MTSIKTKLFILISICVLLTSLIMNSLGFFHISAISNKNAKASMDLTLMAEKERLDTTIQNIRHVVHSMRDVIVSEVKNVDEFAKNPNLCNQTTRYFEELNYTLCYNTDGATAFYLYYNPELFKTDEKGFFWLKGRRSSTFSEVELPDLTAYSKDGYQSVGWYYTTISNRKPTWIHPYFNENTNSNIISYAYPIFIRGKLLGVIGMDIDFSIIINEIESVDLFKTGFAYLTDENKRSIYHREFKTGDLVEEDIYWQSYTTKLSNGWNLSVTAPIKEINAERNRLIAISFLVTIVIAIIFSLVASRFTTHIINPLLELTVATRKIAQGNLNVQISCSTNDEIGILAETFRNTLERLPEYMYRDSLTGIRNANAYKQFLTTLEERISTEENLKFGLVVMDVNNLKQMNDKFGHEAGDQLLIHATHLICRIFAHSPVFRIGGDEFVVYLEGDDLNDITSLMELFDNGQPTFKYKNKAFLISVARGLAMFNKETDSSYEQLFNRADQAMYDNKREIKEKYLSL